MTNHRVCIVGAGFISAVHAEVLKSRQQVSICAIVDPRERAAQAFAERWNVEKTYLTAAEAIEQGNISAVHILTGPEAHFAAARPFLEVGIPVFVEKPFCITSNQCHELIDIAQKSGAHIVVNQNSLFNPVFLYLMEQKKNKILGNLKSIDCIYCMPLRQMETRQFGHWMFREPKNILLEQAVHPLAQIAYLAGPIKNISGSAGSPIEISPGCFFYNDLSLVMGSADVSSMFRFTVGASYPVWLLVATFDDGMVVADLVTGRSQTYQRTPWLDPIDQLVSGIQVSTKLSFDTIKNILNYGLSTVNLRSRSDAFYKSMERSIDNFYDSIYDKEIECANAEFGKSIVEYCETISKKIFVNKKNLISNSSTHCRTDSSDIVVLGGTGFIGRHLIEHLVGEGRRVRVMARNTSNLPEIFHSEQVNVVSGDITSWEDISRVISDAGRVVNLAHGGGGATWREIEESMVHAATNVGKICIERGIKKLVHVSSIAALFLGDSNAIITNNTPLEPKPALRSLYSRGKVEAEKSLLKLHAERNLPVCILRPGVVLGHGTSPFHSGVGYYNNEQHCLGWNRGHNPLPLVLAEDAASAIVSALDGGEQLDGRCFNLVGDVRFSASEYTKILSNKTGRPLRYHGQSTKLIFLEESLKWLVKRIGGRNPIRVTYYDLMSRGLVSNFDCADTKKALSWNPVKDEEEFIQKAFGN